LSQPEDVLAGLTPTARLRFFSQADKGIGHIESKRAAGKTYGFQDRLAVGPGAAGMNLEFPISTLCFETKLPSVREIGRRLVSEQRRVKEKLLCEA